MSKCVRNGALSSLRVLAAFLAISLSTVSAGSTEFGNFWGDQEKEGRAASSEALGGLSILFDALRVIEDQDRNAGIDGIAKAAEFLLSAAARMREIKFSEERPIPFEQLLESDQRAMALSAERFGQPAPKTLPEVYALFAATTEDVGKLLLAQKDTGEPVLPAISDRVVEYISLGSAISRAFGVRR